MDFFEATSAVKKNHKVKRSEWKNDEYLWGNGKYLVHSKPYFEDDPVLHDGGIMGHYQYVAEIDDIEAKDWEIIGV